MTRPSDVISTPSVRFARSLVMISALAVAALNSHSASATEIPDELKGAQITEHSGAQVALGALRFRDESGQEVSLDRYFHQGKPVLLTLVYYECPNLCNFLLNGLVTGLKKLNWTPGHQFEMVTVSINPQETPAMASAKKAAYLAEYGRPEASAGWHFLTDTATVPNAANHETGPAHQLASQVGFGYRWDAQEKQYAHSEAIFLLTPDGRVSRYLYGITFQQKDLRLGLLEASNGRIGTVADRLLLFCYRYDPQTHRYSFVLNRVMQAGSAGTVVVFGAYLAAFWNRQRKQPGEPEEDASEKGV